MTPEPISRDRITVVMRSHNDMPIITDTLLAVREQSVEVELVVFDNASTDGTREEVDRVADRVIHVPAGSYVPGRVLNEAMRCTSGDVVVFLNSDCTPQDARWLEHLVGGLGPGVAATFGRQIPRPDCHPLHARDTESTYGDGEAQKRWRHCFSMASSAIRREVWASMPFDESLQYSEDIDWTWRARQAGWRIHYVQESVVMHSHNYSLAQLYRRHFGEGRAEAAIFDWDAWRGSALRYSVLPYLRQVAGDVKFCRTNGEIAAAVSAPVVRLAQALGRRSGFRAGSRRLAEAR